MNCNNDENKPKLKIKKSWVTNALIAAGYIVLIASLIIGATGARYAETRNVYTDFDAASFNSIILGDLGSSYTQAVKNLKGQNIYAFTEKFNAVDIRPGETRTLSFTVANGDRTINASDVDTVYSIKLRTTGNIPVNFYLTHTCTENGSTVTKIYKPDTAPTVISTGVEGDSNWYEYKFYEVTGSNPETLSGTQAAFNLPGGGLLDLNMHSLVINWPSPSTTATGGKATNDASYMKEVRIFEVLVSVYSLNSSTIKESIGTTEIPKVDADQFYTTGIIYMLVNDDFKIGEQQTRHYPIDYRAFYKGDGTGDESVFRLILHDGIKSNEKPTQEELDTIPEQTNYLVRLRVPVDYIGGTSYAAGDYKYSNVGYSYKLMIGDKALNKLSSSYYLYNANTDSEKLIEGVTTDEQAMAYFDNPDSKVPGTDSTVNRKQSYIYRLDTFTFDGENEYIKSNTNGKWSAASGERYTIIGFRDEVTVYMYDKSNVAVNPADIPGEFSVTRPIDFQLVYKYTNNDPSQNISVS